MQGKFNGKGVLFGGMYTILNSYYGMLPSVFLAADCAEGCDLILVWKSIDDVDPSEQRENGTMHVAAVELKDRRCVDANEWNKKLTALTSNRCLFWLLQELFGDLLTMKFHVVFAGREHLRSSSEVKENLEISCRLPNY
jgi:hypothetical protein